MKQETKLSETEDGVKVTEVPTRVWHMLKSLVETSAAQLGVTGERHIKSVNVFWRAPYSADGSPSLSVHIEYEGEPKAVVVVEKPAEKASGSAYRSNGRAAS